jgi:hypothetical protein
MEYVTWNTGRAGVARLFRSGLSPPFGNQLRWSRSGVRRCSLLNVIGKWGYRVLVYEDSVDGIWYSCGWDAA